MMNNRTQGTHESPADKVARRLPSMEERIRGLATGEHMTMEEREGARNAPVRTSKAPSLRDIGNSGFSNQQDLLREVDRMAAVEKRRGV